MWVSRYSTALHRCSYQRTALFSTSNLRNVIAEAQTTSFDWNDRVGLQEQWTLAEKGWTIAVEYRPTEYGVGVFSLQDVPENKILRKGVANVNLLEFQSEDDILQFCSKHQTLAATSDEYQARLLYAKDYLWGFSRQTDHYGFATQQPDTDRFYGIWLPGNGLNHSPSANTVYRSAPDGIDLIALTDIEVGVELTDDYRRHGRAPGWLANFGRAHNVTLNFADCNDFV